MPECRSFAPLVTADCRFLLLGSMPGVRSLKQQEYYAHPQNRFWRLLALLLQEPVPLGYEEKKALLARHGIALWDTLSYCEREGSLDSQIRRELPNDIPGLLADFPSIRAVGCNGGRAAAACKKYFADSLPAGMRVYDFPSTSPANARMDLAALAEAWRPLLQYLRS